MDPGISEKNSPLKTSGNELKRGVIKKMHKDPKKIESNVSSSAKTFEKLLSSASADMFPEEAVKKEKGKEKRKDFDIDNISDGNGSDESRGDGFLHDKDGKGAEDKVKDKREIEKAEKKEEEKSGYHSSAHGHDGNHERRNGHNQRHHHGYDHTRVNEHDKVVLSSSFEPKPLKKVDSFDVDGMEKDDGLDCHGPNIDPQGLLVGVDGNTDSNKTTKEQVDDILRKSFDKMLASGIDPWSDAPTLTMSPPGPGSPVRVSSSIHTTPIRRSCDLSPSPLNQLDEDMMVFKKTLDEIEAEFPSPTSDPDLLDIPSFLSKIVTSTLADLDIFSETVLMEHSRLMDKGLITMS